MADEPRPSDPTRTERLALCGRQIDIAVWGSDTPTIVMLHEGLGSIRGWRAVPSVVHTRTGESVVAYNRPGHGESEPTPTGPWPADWLHSEAAFLPSLLAAIEADAPLLVGHSDGGTAALLAQADGHLTPRGIVTLAAHSWVEQLCFDSIVTMREQRDDIVAGLARSHADPAAVFDAWSGVWVSKQFRSWDIRPSLHRVEAPTLIAQGAEDEYASQEHAHATARAVGANAESVLVDGVSHMMHHHDPEAIVELIVGFAAHTR